MSSKRLDHFASVALVLNASQVYLALDIARLLKSRFGSRIHLYMRTPAQVRGLERRTKDHFWDSLTVSGIVDQLIDAEVADPDRVFAAARQYETLTGETINRFMMAHRQLNRGYSIGGFNLPRVKRYLNASYVQKVNAVVALLRFWDNEIQSKKLTLIIDADKEAAALAAAAGIAYRRLHLARYKNRQFWAPDIYQTNPAIAGAFASIADGPAVELRGGYGAAGSKVKMALARTSLRQILFRVPLALARQVAMLAIRHPQAQNIDLLATLMTPFRERSALKRIRKLARTKLTDLQGREFVYFPLQKEPEIALNQAAPELPSQHACIISISRDLPAGVVLAVKEYVVSVLGRPDGFYEQIASLPNVVLLDPFENSVDVIKASAATAVIFGTAGLEAALLGKPVISFARRIPWGILDHVKIVSEETQLQGYLKEAVEGIDEQRARRDGERFLAALIASSFDMGSFRIDRSATRGATPELAEIAFNGLVDSVRRFGAAGSNQPSLARVV